MKTRASAFAIAAITFATALAACKSDQPNASVTFAASGEIFALTGYPFPPAKEGDFAFVDGWEVKLDRLLVTIDNVTLSENPDAVLGDPFASGAVVARVNGPWAVDLAKSDPLNIPGKGGPGEEAVPIATLDNQNANGGKSFATDGTRYAFGFDAIAASPAAEQVNLDPAAVDDYALMIQDKCTVLYVGTATFKGGTVEGHTDCNADPIYARWPKVVSFRFCFKSPTSYRNCQNPDNAGPPLSGEEAQRGIAFESNRAVIAQMTFHADHPFWDSVVHDSPAHFDQFAGLVAGASNSDGSPPTVTLEAAHEIDYTQVTDALGRALPWRYCIDPPTDAHPKLTGPMSFDPQTVPHAPGNAPALGLRDYYDFSTYLQSTQGHLNSDGLCAVVRNYPSPE